MAVGVSLSATSAFANGGGILDQVGDKTRDTVEKTTGTAKSGAKSTSSKAKSGKSEKASSSRRTDSGSTRTDRPRANRSDSKPSNAGRAQRQVTRESSRTVRNHVRSGQRSSRDRVNRTEKSVERTASRVSRSEKSIKRTARAKAVQNVREIKITKTQPALRPDRVAKADQTQKAVHTAKPGKSKTLVKINEVVPEAVLTKVVDRTDTVLAGSGLPTIAAPATERVADLVATAGGQVDHHAAPVVRSANGLLARAKSLLESALPIQPLLPALPLLPELPGLPDVPSLPTPPVPSDASGSGSVLPMLGSNPEIPAIASPAPTRNSSSTPAIESGSAATDRVVLDSTAAVAFPQVVSGLIASMPGSVGGPNASAVGAVVGLLAVVALGAAGALGTSGSLGSGVSGLSFVALATSLGFAARPAQGRVDVSRLRLAAWQRPNRPGFAPD